jgi:hypothetical protein
MNRALARRQREMQLRSSLQTMAAQVLARPSPAAIHESAHEYVAKQAGCREVGAFVRSRGEGVCYFTFPRSFRGIDGRYYPFGLNAIRWRAKIALSGYVAEHLADREAVPGWETLLRREGDRTRPDGNIFEPYLANAADEFGGDVELAVSWLERMFPEARLEVIYDLRHSWPQIVRRARQLDERWKGNR